MIRSPLRYPGGKSRLAKHIAPLLASYDEYREPFLGGGSVLLSTKQLFPEKRFWGNDYFTPLINFWKSAQAMPEELTHQIIEFCAMLTGKALYDFLKVNYAQFTFVEQAAAFFILNRITFGGSTFSGGYSQSAFQGRLTPSSIERIKTVVGVLASVKLSNVDYSHLLYRQSRHKVFIYLDPPYYSASKLYGVSGDLHQQFDHAQLAQHLKTCSHHWLMTYDDSEYIRSLYQDYTVLPFQLSYGLNKKTGNEIFISNDAAAIDYLNSIALNKKTA